MQTELVLNGGNDPELLTAVRARARWVPDDALVLVRGAALPRRSGAAHE